MTPQARAEEGIKLLQNALIDLLEERRDWMTRWEVATSLGIQRFGEFFVSGLCNDLVDRSLLEFETGSKTVYRLRKSSTP